MTAGEIARAGEAHAAAHARAVHSRDGGLGAGGDAVEHRREAPRVLEVRPFGRHALTLHPVDVGARAESPASGGEDDRAHLRIDGRRRECRVDLGDHRLVECIQRGVARQLDSQHAAGAALDREGRHQPKRTYW